MKKNLTFGWQEILTSTVSLYRKNFDRFLQPITIQILLALIVLIISTFDFPFHSAVYGIIAVLSLAVNIWLTVVFLNISQSVFRNEKTPLDLTYQKSLNRLPQFTAVFALTILISAAAFMAMYLLWAIVAAFTIEKFVSGDPQQYLSALEHTLTYDPANVVQFLNPGIIALLLLGLLSIIPAIYILVRYSFAIIQAAISNEKESVMKFFAINYKLTKNKFWKILADYAVPMIIFSALQSIIMIGLGSIATAGKYQILELSGNIYYNILSIVIAGLFAPLSYLVLIATFHKINEHSSIKQD